MKKIINKNTEIVNEMIEGLVLSNPKLERVTSFNVITRKDKNQNKVRLISGGGSGHEPAHAGFVGKGMLDAAVLGEVFTSPTPDQITEAIRAFPQNEFLLIVKNYTGDKLNFEIAKELAEMEGKKVEIVMAADDVAVENSTWTIGRRGISGTVYIHKIAGALAEKGASLEEVKRVAEKVSQNVRSFGISLNSIYNPVTGLKSFELDEKTIEFGLGIHGEPGIERTNIQSSKEMVTKMIDLILKDYDYSNSEVALMINGLGGTPEMELFIANYDANNYLKSKGISVVENNVGNFMTSLEMQGLSISILKLDEEMKELLKEATEVKSWK